MIYPLLPLFLSSVLGAGALALGVIEGVAESTAAFLKVVSGIWTDRTRRRKPLIVAGYGLSGSVRPLIGLATAWPAVLALRFTDRIGKGLRSSPRDALIADSVEPARRGEAFGFQRMMDHGGAVLGPLVAAGLLSIEHLSLRHVFLLAALPAVAVMLILLGGVHEPPAAPARADAPEPRSLLSWKLFPPDFVRLLAALAVFTLGNSSDAFILLRLNDAGVPAAAVALLWSLHHVLKVGASALGGRWSDRMGRRPLMIAGWSWYAAVYLAFAMVDDPHGLAFIFILYGLYFGMVEPVERAWVVDLVPAERRGSALGLYQGVVGLTALPASLLFGAVWQAAGSAWAFGFGAALAAVASLLLLRVRPQRSKPVGPGLGAT